VHSLRAKLVLGILSSLALLLGVGGAVAYFAIKKRLYSEFDRSLVQRAVLLASMIELDGGTIKIEWLESEGNPSGHQTGADYFSVWKKDGNDPLASSPTLKSGSLPRFGGSFAHPALREVTLPDGRAARCVGIEFDVDQGLRDDDDAEESRTDTTADSAAAPPGATTVQLVIAELDTVAPTLAAIRRPLIGLWTGCTILGGIIIWLVVGQSLQPLYQLKAQIGSLKEDTAGQRIRLPQQATELEPVTEELNRLLERVEKVLVRERTLTSNVAHELRTPIAGLLSTLEVTLNRVRSSEEYRESTTECFEIAKRMNWLVNNLLSITRIEAGNVQLEKHDVGIASALAEWWKPFENRATERSLSVEWQIDPGARIETDLEFFRVVVTNLFDNAVSYAPEGGTIRIHATSEGTISVANPANGLKAEVIERAFEPFWRNAGATDGEVAHAGLGLNLCKKIIELLGGRISAHLKQPDGLFVVRLEMA
jgi:signal transduction histidine kinase